VSLCQKQIRPSARCQPSSSSMTRRIIQPEEALTLAPANHKILVRAPQVTPNRVLPAAMARIPLHNPAHLKVHQDRFVIRLVDQQELVVAADGERRGAGVQFVVVQVLARGEAVDVDASLSMWRDARRASTTRRGTWTCRRTL
jgi:hypothetical protein